MPKFPKRQAEPEQEFSYSNADGTQETLKADSKGTVQAKTQADENVLLAFGLPAHGDKAEAQKAEASEPEKE